MICSCRVPIPSLPRFTNSCGSRRPPRPPSAPFRAKEEGTGGARREREGGPAVKMSVAPGCHRRPLLRMAPLPRPLGDPPQPRDFNRPALPQAVRPHPDRNTQGNYSPLHLSPSADSLTQTVPHVISHQRHTKRARSASSSQPRRPPHPTPQGDGLDHPPPQPQDGVGEGAS